MGTRRDARRQLIRPKRPTIAFTVCRFGCIHPHKTTHTCVPTCACVCDAYTRVHTQARTLTRINVTKRTYASPKTRKGPGATSDRREWSPSSSRPKNRHSCSSSDSRRCDLWKAGDARWLHPGEHSCRVRLVAYVVTILTIARNYSALKETCRFCCRFYPAISTGHLDAGYYLLRSLTDTERRLTSIMCFKGPNDVKIVS